MLLYRARVLRIWMKFRYTKEFESPNRWPWERSRQANKIDDVKFLSRRNVAVLQNAIFLNELRTVHGDP